MSGHSSGVFLCMLVRAWSSFGRHCQCTYVHMYCTYICSWTPFLFALTTPTPHMTVEQTLIPCQFCGQPFAKSALQQHQVSGGNNTERRGRGGVI